MTKFSYLISFVLLFSCIPSSNYDKEIVDTFKFDHTNNNESIELIYYFDGGCPYCVTKLIKFYSQYLKLNVEVPCIIIAHSCDLDKVEYYLEKSGCNLREQDLLLLDANYSILENNKFLKNSGQEIFLINYRYEIIYQGNPFQNNKNTRIFKNILKMDLERNLSLIEN
jgi:hypothetical protein